MTVKRFAKWAAGVVVFVIVGAILGVVSFKGWYSLLLLAGSYFAGQAAYYAAEKLWG